MPVKNGEKYISRAMGQLLRNYKQGDQILVVDDNSSDQTARMLEEYSYKYNFVQVFKNPGSGLVSGLNFGIRCAQNPWIARFDVDDIYVDNRIEEQRKIISDETVAIFCDYHFLNDFGENLGHMPSAIFPSATSISLITSTRSPHPGVIFNRTAAIEVGLYRSEDFLAEDLSLWLRLSRVGSLRTCPLDLLGYVLNSESITANNRLKMLRKKQEVIEKIGINPKDIETICSEIDDVFSAYNQTEYGQERKILLFRDLLILSKYNQLNWSIPRLLQKGFKSIFNPQTLSIMIHFELQKRKRKRIRLN